ncbi:hypothetical protein TKK_0000061 [Trichogramma kaykai]|uniref:BTB domain-containing protein n=1 Tax=Trichogramma kaykai TaxID=54128 RepID=A0ABD2VUA3_9HYME
MSSRGDDSSSIGTNDDLPNSENEAEQKRIRESIETRKATERAAKIGQASTSAAIGNDDDHRPEAKKVAQPKVVLLPRIAEPPSHRRPEEEAKTEGRGEEEKEEEEEEAEYFTFNWKIVLQPEHIKQSVVVHSSIFKTDYFEVSMSAQTVYEACQNCRKGQRLEAWHLHLYCRADCGAAGINLSNKFEFRMATESGNEFSFCRLDNQNPTFQGKIGLAQEPNLTESRNKVFMIQCRLSDSCFLDRTRGDPRTRSLCIGVHQDIHANYFDMLERGEYSDVTIKCGDYEFKAHRHILSAASLTLRDWFKKVSKSTPPESIVINDVPVRTFQIFLKCIYTGVVAGLREHFDEYMWMAHFFFVPSLFRVLYNFIHIVLNNVGIDPGELVEGVPTSSGLVFEFDHEYQQLCLEAELARGSDLERRIIAKNSGYADADGNAANSTGSDRQQDAAWAWETTNPIDRRKQKKHKKIQKKPSQLSDIDEARASVEREAARQAEEERQAQMERVPAPEPERARAPPPAQPEFVPVASRRTIKLSKRQAKKNK